MAKSDQYLHLLIPEGGLYAWYPLYDREDLISSDGVKDESGNSRDLLSTGTPAQTYLENAINSRPAVVHLATQYPLVAAGEVALKHVFMLAKSDEASTFAANRGLLTAETSTALWVGESGQTRFVDLSIGGSFAYIKSQTSYTEANQQAPFNNFELIEASESSGGFSLGALQVGQDRADTGKRFVGKWAELVCYTTTLTGNDLARLRLYFDLKFSLWTLNGTTLVFPNASILNVHGTEKYSEYFGEYRAGIPDFEAITLSHEYTDGGKTFNEVNTSAPERWQVSILGVEAEQADVYDAFNRQARRANTFDFTDKYGVLHTDVQVERYARRHNAHKSWRVDCRFELVKYP